MNGTGPRGPVPDQRRFARRQPCNCFRHRFRPTPGPPFLRRSVEATLSTLSLPKRLSPAESRGAALIAAQQLLIESGPAAVTLKAVGARIGRTHANLLHHFGSAEGLQRALIVRMADQITGTIRDAVLHNRAGDPDPRRIVDLVFDAFDSGGAGALASWMILSGNRDALDPILSAVHDLVDELAAGMQPAARPIRDETLHLVLMALGDALLGAPMARALDLPRGKARDLAVGMLSVGDSAC